MAKNDRLAIHGGTPVRAKPFPGRRPFGDEEIRLLTKAVRSQSLFGIGGVMVTEFERRFAKLYAAKVAVASSSGTAAIHVALGAVNPDPGDEIITAPITDAGTIVPILMQNLVPVFADVDKTYNMDPEDVEAKITPRTRAILVVHIFGNPCDMDRMVAIARRRRLALIEDCCQAHMTEYKGKLLGTFGDIGCFSLQQSKHMTTGDGGMTISSNKKYLERMPLFRDKGWSRHAGRSHRIYQFLAPNYRMTELQGAVGIAQVAKVRGVVRRRNELGNLLTALIRGVPGVEPVPVTPGGKHTYWHYPLRVTGAGVDNFAAALSAEGVGGWPRYIGVPIFLCMAALADKVTYGRSHHPLDGCHGGRILKYAKGMCPRAEDMLQHLLVLGIHEHMTRDDIADMAAAIRKVAQGLDAQEKKSVEARSRTL